MIFVCRGVLNPLTYYLLLVLFWYVVSIGF